MNKVSKPFIGDFSPGQLFGQNFNDYYKKEGLLGHQGIDFPMPNGTPIISAVNGIVVAISKDIQKGEGLAILSTDKFDYKGQECLLDTIYWHLQDKSILVNIGDTVVIGQRLGLSNNTGQSTGPHLHFSIIPMATDGSRRALAGINNGYKGCVNPLPYCDWITEPDVAFSHSWKIPLSKVKDFQNKHGLVADGIVGPKTQAVLDSLINA